MLTFNRSDPYFRSAEIDWFQNVSPIREGQNSRRVIRHSRGAPGTRADWNGTHYEALLTPRETGGKFGVFASDAGPGSGPPRHRHPKSDEVFVILQGRYVSGVPGKVPNVLPEKYSTFPLALSTRSSSLSVHDGSASCPRVVSKAFSRRLRHKGWRFRAISLKSNQSRPNSIWRSPGDH